jgi:hypothetical protein
VRTYASSKEEPSWRELAREAAALATTAAKKLGDGVSNVGRALVGDKTEEKRAVERRRREEDAGLSAGLSGMLGGGLVGRALGSLLGAGVRAVAGQMQVAMASSTELHARACRVVESDSRVVAALGTPVRCSPPQSVSSSSVNVNGVSTTSTQLTFTASGPRGIGVVSVSARGERTEMAVRLPGVGEVRLSPGGGGGGGGGGAGRIIDVEAEDYRVR